MLPMTMAAVIHVRWNAIKSSQISCCFRAANTQSAGNPNHASAVTRRTAAAIPPLGAPVCNQRPDDAALSRRRLKTLLAIRCQNSPSNGRSDRCLFGGGPSPIPMQMASANSIVDPVAGVCQFGIVECRTQKSRSAIRCSISTF